MKALFAVTAAAAVIGFAAPAVAQGIYFEGPGVSVGVGPRYEERRVYREYEPEYRYRREHRAYADRDCRTITIQRDDGSYRRIRRCD